MITEKKLPQRSFFFLRAVIDSLLQSFGGVYVIPSEPFASERSHRRKKKSLLGFLFSYALFANVWLSNCISAAQGTE